MEIVTMPVGSYQTNCYMVFPEQGKHCVLIDPGFQPEEILEQVALRQKTVEAILLTHGHFDHVGGVKKIAQQTGCRVYICREDLSLNPMITAGAIYYTDTYTEGESLSVAGLAFQVLHTPGHTPGSVCLLAETAIFSGDTLFQGSCGRTDLPGGDWPTIPNSLKRLAALEGNFWIFPGHGPSTTLRDEKKYNPYMK
mgnify:CR=1 FL=1